MSKIKKYTVTFILLMVAFSSITMAKVDDKKPQSKSKIEYFEIDSPSLKSFEKVKVGVYLPTEYNSIRKRFPVIYYLPGFGQNETSWEKMGIKTILDGLIEKKSVPPTIVVSIGSKDTGWLNWYSGKYKWEDFLKKDLIQAIDKKYRTVRNACGRGISGNSMGGIGALTIGFKNRDIFGSISAHSAAIHPENPKELPDWAKNWDGWNERMGKPIDVNFWRQTNPISLAEMFGNSNRSNEAIYFDVGNKDQLGFAKTNILLSERLKELEIPHEFHLREGKHGSQFVKDNAQFALEFHAKEFARQCRN